MAYTKFKIDQIVVTMLREHDTQRVKIDGRLRGLDVGWTTICDLELIIEDDALAHMQTSVHNSMVEIYPSIAEIESLDSWISSKEWDEEDLVPEPVP